MQRALVDLKLSANIKAILLPFLELLGVKRGEVVIRGRGIKIKKCRHI